MDNLFDKLGLYDFFNVLISGTVVFCSILFTSSEFYKVLIGILPDVFLRNTVLLITIYLLGLFCQEVGTCVEDKFLKIKESLTGNFLNNDNNVVGNEYKIKAFQKLSEDILKELGFDEENIDFNQKQSMYIFAYCMYYIENKSKNKKVEKMRALYGMAKNLMGSSIVALVSLIISFVTLFYLKINFCISLRHGYIILGCVVLFIMSLERAKRYMKYMIKMTMSVYQVCKNEEREFVIK